MDEGGGKPEPALFGLGTMERPQVRGLYSKLHLTFLIKYVQPLPLIPPGEVLLHLPLPLPGDPPPRGPGAPRRAGLPLEGPGHALQVGHTQIQT